MKTQITKMLLVVIAILMTSGCALFRPPMWVTSTTEIEKDSNGRVKSSKYYRHAVGFSDNDKESARSWAEADSVAQPVFDNTSTNTNGNTTGKGKFDGLIYNNSTCYINTKIQGESFERTYYLKPYEKKTDVLFPGTYTAVSCCERNCSDGWTFHVRPKNKNSFMGENVYWYLVHQR